MNDFDIVVFKRRVAETIAWCKPRFSIEDDKIAHCLRTPPEPAPNITHRFSSFCEVQIFDGVFENIAAFAEIVFQKRAAAFEERDEKIYTGLCGGRLLVSYVDRETCEGTSPSETACFLDDCDTPAWDTWVYYGVSEKRYLISWIPAELHSMMEEAIWANSLEVIAWIEDARPQLIFFEEIKLAGLFFNEESNG